MRTYRCRQCEHIATSKPEFWQHSRIHIKPEKLLCCDKCEFVTEYKHHLEYHHRNHTGVKPFRCDQCQYECVNKSMLNSHLKSHSSHYQYRCHNCSYATKYVHSLKLHLRKYQHEPTDPIIDVYGTRRGPRTTFTQIPTTPPIDGPLDLSMYKRRSSQ
ncbi:Protein hunchback, partial [Fragariocoptes setiger]